MYLMMSSSLVSTVVSHQVRVTIVTRTKSKAEDQGTAWPALSLTLQLGTLPTLINITIIISRDETFYLVLDTLHCIVTISMSNV